MYKLTAASDLLSSDVIMITEALPRNVETPVQVSELKVDD